MDVSTVAGSGAAAIGSCSHTGASAAEARTGCSSATAVVAVAVAAAVGKPTTFELIIVIIIRTNSAAAMKPFGVLVQTTVHFTGLVKLVSVGSGLHYLSQALSTSASGCVDKRLPAIGSSGAATGVSLSATAIVG